MTDGSWQDLYDRWKNSLDGRAVKDPQHRGHWFSIWRMIIGHDWFQQHLRACIHFEIISSQLPPDLADDLEQEVILLLAGKLARQTDLGMDVELAEKKFPAYLGTIIHNDCRQVARKLRRQFVRSPSLLSPQCIEDPRRSFEKMSLEIETLKDPQRTILLLKLKGMTLKEIAQQMRMNYSKVCREYDQGCRRLAKTL